MGKSSFNTPSSSNQCISMKGKLEILTMSLSVKFEEDSRPALSHQTKWYKSLNKESFVAAPAKKPQASWAYPGQPVRVLANGCSQRNLNVIGAKNLSAISNMPVRLYTAS